MCVWSRLGRNHSNNHLYRLVETSILCERYIRNHTHLNICAYLGDLSMRFPYMYTNWVSEYWDFLRSLSKYNTCNHQQQLTMENKYVRNNRTHLLCQIFFLGNTILQFASVVQNCCCILWVNPRERNSALSCNKAKWLNYSLGLINL